jgi:hypothetical protein
VSLISEALKRARLEAARREGEERGTVYASAPAYTPRRRQPPIAVVIAACAMAGLLAGAGAFWALRGGAPGSPRPEAPKPAPAPALSAPVPAPQMPEPERAVPSSASTPAPESLAPPSAPVAPPIPVAPPRASAPPAPPAAPPTKAAAAPASAPSAAKAMPAAPAPPGAPPAEGRTYSRAVDLPGGQRLELDGIVASPTDPLAMMNRRLMAPGEVIDGYTLVRIEPKRVEMRGPDGAIFFLSLR